MIGQTVSHYRILENIGRGGMGDVYLGIDERLQRKVALKTIRAERRLNVAAQARFTREARTAAQLEHPNIISIYRVGKTGRVIYFVMKYLRGGSLSQVLAERKKLDDELRREVTQALEAFQERFTAAKAAAD